MKLLSSLILTLSFLIFSSFATGPTGIVPSVDIKTLEGKTVNIQDYTGKGKITVLSFWATWCSPCKRELDAISDIYEDWQKDYNMELVAVTIDDARSMAKVPALVAVSYTHLTLPTTPYV